MGIVKRTRCTRHAGFTLVELMVVVLIVGVLLTLGVPGMRDLLLSSRMSGKLNEFVGAMQTARGAAVKNNAPVRLCRSASGSTCDGAGWQDGWIVFADYNDNGDVNAAAAPFPADEVIAQGSAATGFSFKQGLAAVNTIRFRPDGSAGLDCSTASDCELRFCIGGEAEGLITINTAGRPTASKKIRSQVTGCP